MKKVKTFEEYRYLKLDPSKKNVKDPKEPFFNEPKYDYKRKKEIFGEVPKHELIEIDLDVINNIIESRPSFGEMVDFVLKKIKKYAEDYKSFMILHTKDEDYLDSYLVFADLEDNDIRILDRLGFGIYIYDDSNEYSEYFSDKTEVSWEWK